MRDSPSIVDRGRKAKQVPPKNFDNVDGMSLYLFSDMSSFYVGEYGE